MEHEREVEEVISDFINSFDAFYASLRNNKPIEGEIAFKAAIMFRRELGRIIIHEQRKNNRGSVPINGAEQQPHTDESASIGRTGDKSVPRQVLHEIGQSEDGGVQAGNEGIEQ